MREGSLIVILAPMLGAMCLATVFVIALGIVAARADEHVDRQLTEERSERARAETFDLLPVSASSGSGVATRRRRM